jgi:hypothetical protein
MFGGAMSFGYVWWSYGIWMFGGAMGSVCLVELCALDVWWSYGLWMFGRTMGLAV